VGKLWKLWALVRVRTVVRRAMSQVRMKECIVTVLYKYREGCETKETLIKRYIKAMQRLIFNCRYKAESRRKSQIMILVRVWLDECCYQREARRKNRMNS
jgi:hypothetical protein